eukprot:scaffold33382_cov34-Attheya_sp.AAC.5
MDDPIPDLTDDAVPFKFESHLWKIFIQDSQKILYGSINPLARYFRFYVTSVIVAGGNSSSTTIIRKKMVLLEDFIRMRGSLDIFWMQDLTLEVKMIKSSPLETRLARAHYHAQTHVRANRDSYKTSMTN